MAFLLALFPAIAEAVAGSAIAETAVAAAAETIAAEGTAAIAATTTAEAAAAATAAGEAVTGTVIATDVTAGVTAAEATTVASSSIWQSLASFTTWVGKETAKGAAFYAGMKGVDAFFQLLASPDAKEAPSPDLKTAANLIHNIADASHHLHNATAAWLKWANDNFDKRNDFGSVDVSGTTLLRFQIFQNRLGKLSDMLGAIVTPCLLKAKADKTLDATNKLKDAMQKYCAQVKAVSDEIQKHESAMIAAGLSDYKGDIDQALAALNK